MTWKDHVDHRHYPFRRDCQICQEPLHLPHRKVKHPLCEPCHTAPDVVGEAKYMLVPKKSPLKARNQKIQLNHCLLKLPSLSTSQMKMKKANIKHQVIFSTFLKMIKRRKRAIDPTGALGNGEDPTRDSIYSEGGKPALEGLKNGASS